MSSKGLNTALVSMVLGCAISPAPILLQAGETAEGAPTITVSYADLNLASVEGAKTLYGRIKAAARLVCPSVGRTELHRQQQIDQCRRAAISRAVQQVDSTVLASMHATDSGRT